MLELLEYQINSADEHTMRFNWEAGIVAIWDNRCTALKHISSTGYFKGFETSSSGEKRKFTYLSCMMTSVDVFDSILRSAQ